MLTRLARWWLNRKQRQLRHMHKGECICGREVTGDALHIVVAIPGDDAGLGIEGQTAMSADFCAEHCPGGCLAGCSRATVT